MPARLLHDLEAFEQFADLPVFADGVDENGEGAVRKRLPLGLEDRSAVAPFAQGGVARDDFPDHDQGDALFALRLLCPGLFLPADFLRIAGRVPTLARLAVLADHLGVHPAFVDLDDLPLVLGQPVAAVEVDGGAHLALDQFTKPDGLVADQGSERNDPLDDGILAARDERDDGHIAGVGQKADTVVLGALEGPDLFAVLVGHRRDGEREELVLLAADHGDGEHVVPVLDRADFHLVAVVVLRLHQVETREVETRFLGLGHVGRLQR